MSTLNRLILNTDKMKLKVKEYKIQSTQKLITKERWSGCIITEKYRFQSKVAGNKGHYIFD